ncbi:MAG: hypothetical protein H7039_08445 [Bryobacteraceae bacterium]|nr:hypothetical protein [Bryobacteraceae bacterium]
MSLFAERFYEEKVALILKKHCLGCHNHELDAGGISFENDDTLRRERGKGGVAIVPFQPEKSSLVRALRHNGDVQMPPGKKLPSKDIKVLIEWIRRGAPRGSSGVSLSN